MNSICWLLTTWVTSVSLLATDAPALREWMLDGVTREALVYAPPAATTDAAPVVFVFHGHGGSMNQAARSFHLHTLWPGAIVIYPQGLRTPGQLTDPKGRRAGWQAGIGDQADRDLRFFDTILNTMTNDYSVDGKRIYATGHSNGGGFTYLLWVLRGDRLRAVAPSAATMALKNFHLLKPKPVLHIAGGKDTLVKFAWQDQTMKFLRRLNRCGKGTLWQDEPWCIEYASDIDVPVVTCIHPGKHNFPAEAPEIIVKFFQEQSARESKNPD